MEIPYSFLQKQVNKQFKDLAFFQILKRKGPYIERSLIKIQNDLFYKHKLSGVKMKNVSFIKQIRFTLAAYQVIINQIKNDFMMTQLDSLGDSIHRLFVQMISIINFFSAIILKKQKLAFNDLKDVNLQELRQKQQVLKKMEDQQKAKQSQEKQKENQRLKEIEKLKYNVRQLFKLQVNSDKQNKLIESLWKTIVTENKNNVKQCMKIKDSELNRIIKDSCEYLYKNHTELDNIIRLTKQDILQSQKTLNGFGDKTHLLEQNQQKINHMKCIAKQIVQYVRQKVYDKKDALVQTTFTNIDTSKPFMTTKQLDERRKMQVKIKSFEKTTKQRQVYIQQVQKKLKQTQDKLKIALQKLDEQQDSQSDDDGQSSKNNSNNPVANKFVNLSRKSKNNNFNSFKINPTTKNSAMLNKFREASFTVGKKFSKLSKNSCDSQPFYQKGSNRSSSTSKDFSLQYNKNSHYNNKSTRNLMSSFDMSSSPSQNSGERANKKFYKVRQSCLVVEAKSFQQLSRKSQRSRAQTLFQDDKQNQKERSRDGVSIDDLKSGRQSISVISANFQNQLKNQQLQKKHNDPDTFTITQTFKLFIRPLRMKRYLQSTYKHPLSQEKGPTHLLESRLLKSSKLKKSESQHQISRYFFQPLNNMERFGTITQYKDIAKIQIEKKKVFSATSSPKAFESLHNKENKQYLSRYNGSAIPQLNAISFVKLKNQNLNKSNRLKQNPSILKGCIKSSIGQKGHNKKQSHALLKKSSAKQTVSFAFLPGSQSKKRKSMHIQIKNGKIQKNVIKLNNRVTIGQSDTSYAIKSSENQTIMQVNQTYQ